jgi:hypothetical protein
MACNSYNLNTCIYTYYFNLSNFSTSFFAAEIFLSNSFNSDICIVLFHFCQRYKKPLSLTIAHDANKFNACKENSVNLIYYIPDRVNRYIKDKPSFYEGNYLLSIEDVIKKIKNA